MEQNFHLIKEALNPSLVNIMVKNYNIIENWFRDYWNNKTPIFYNSIDIRLNNYKLAHVDSNIFPAGFNNIKIEDYALCIQAIQSIIYEINPSIKNIAIVSEYHTRNLFYLENIFSLSNIFKMAGYNVIIVNPQLEEEYVNIKLENNRNINIYKLYKKDGVAYSNKVTPCIFIVNNDMIQKPIEELQGIRQKVIPDLFYGWYQRTKWKHFKAYEKVCKDFIQLIDIDPWLISTLYDQVNDMNINDKDDLMLLEEKTAILLDKIAVKYRQYNVKQEPFVVLKANAGTYGMGILTIKNILEIRNLNRKGRKELAQTKSKVKINSILIQEGVFTNFSLYDNYSAEPTLYLVSRYIIGGFYRFHSEKKNNESLNAVGMKFDPIAIEKPCCIANSENLEDPINAFYVLGVIARLANIAAYEEKFI